jgi:hypothetical protein
MAHTRVNINQLNKQADSLRKSMGTSHKTRNGKTGMNVSQPVMNFPYTTLMNTPGYHLVTQESERNG